MEIKSVLQYSTFNLLNRLISILSLSLSVEAKDPTATKHNSTKGLSYGATNKPIHYAVKS
jgi:hypothetical protein